VLQIATKTNMSRSSPHAVTKLLLAWSNGDTEALNALTPLVYEELYRRARRYMMQEVRRDRHPLQATALVNEVYIKLIDWKNVQWQNRAQFFAVAANLMRHVLVDIARSWRSMKNSGAFRRITLNEGTLVSKNRTEEIIAVDEALMRLEQIYPRAGRVVELRHYGGLNIEQIAEVLKVSDETVRQDWILAKAWLNRELGANRHDAGTDRKNLSRGART
jgi:RNA polymerase sigma factor (TIGR02999 family)